MKKSLLIICTLGLVMSCTKNKPVTSPGPSDVHLDQGLLVYLPFNGTFADESGNNNPTQPIDGAILSEDGNGHSNEAFAGNGVNARVLVINGGSIRFDTAFTISINGMITKQQRQAFVTMTDNTTGEGTSFGFGPGLPTINNFDYSVCDSLESCNSGITATNNFIDTTSFVMQTNTWYNMIGVYHKGTMKLYVNGALVSTYLMPGTTAFDCPTARMILGGWWDGDPAGLAGKISAFRFYNRLLNNDEIAKLADDFQRGND